MRSRPKVLALMLAAGLAVVSGAPVGAQTGGPVASGEFTGSVGVYGGFTMDLDEGSATVVADGEGPLQITLTDGTMSGTWSLDGTTFMFGSFGEGVVVMGGEGTMSGSGTVSGPPGQYRMVGSITSTNTVTATVSGVMSQSASSTSTDPLDEQLTGVIVLCDTIVGRWDVRIRQEIEAAGFEEFIRGYFTASTGVDATEQAQQVEDLIADVAAWAGGQNEVAMESQTGYVNTAFGLLNRAQRLQAELEAPTPCPPDPLFTTQLTMAVQDVLGALIARFPGITTSALVTLGLGSGAIGSGSPAPEGAAALEAALEADVQAKWNDLVADEGSFLGDVLDTARAAQMLGITELGDSGLSPADVILVITGENP